MLTLSDYDHLELTLIDNKITSYVDIPTCCSLKTFHQRLITKIPKLYILKEDNDYLYVGTTSQSLTSRMRYGLTVHGKSGYHGYKWKAKEKVTLFVWRFIELSKLEIENIEAELVFLIRQKTGKWPLHQNEIHFNNNFSDAKILADELYRATKHIRLIRETK